MGTTLRGLGGIAFLALVACSTDERDFDKATDGGASGDAGTGASGSAGKGSGGSGGEGGEGVSGPGLTISCPSSGLSVDCLACTVTLLGEASEPVDATSAVAFELQAAEGETEASGVLFSDDACESEASGGEIAVGESSTTVYLKAPPGEWQVSTVNEAGLNDGSASITIESSAPSTVTIEADVPLVSDIFDESAPTVVDVGLSLPDSGGTTTPATVGTSGFDGDSLSELAAVAPTEAGEPAAPLATVDLSVEVDTTITVTATFPESVTGTCEVLPAHESLSCDLASFDIARSAIEAGGLQIRAQAQGAPAADYTDSNVLPTNVFRFQKVIDLGPGDNDDTFEEAAVLGDKVYLGLSHGGTSVYEIDPVAGTARKFPALPSVNEAVTFGDSILFSGVDASDNYRLYALNPAAPSITRVSNLSPTDALVPVGTFGAFALAEGANGELYRVGAAPTFTVERISSFDNVGSHYLGSDNCLYFGADNSSNYRKLYKLCGTILHVPVSFQPTASDGTTVVGVHNEKVFFMAAQTGAVRKLFSYAPGTGTVTRITDVNGGAATDFVDPTVEFDGKLALAIGGISDKVGPFIWDDTARTMTRLTPATHSAVENMTVVGDTLFFSAKVGGFKKLFRYRPDAAEPVRQVADTAPGGNDVVVANSSLLEYEGQLLAILNTSSGQRFLYAYDPVGDRMYRVSARSMYYFVTKVADGVLTFGKDPDGFAKFYYMTLN